MIGRISIIIALMALVIIQVSFLTTWPSPINNLNLLLGIVIFLTVIFGYDRALWWAFGGGLLLESFSALPFGVTSISLVVTVVGINFLFNNFFTNRSLYSLVVLGYVGTVIFNILELMLSIVINILNNQQLLIQFNLAAMFIWQPLLCLIILGIIFITYSVSTGRLRTIFISSNSTYEITGKR